MGMTIVLIIIVLIFLTFLCTDLFVRGKEWVDRIHIGRWESRNYWQIALEKRAKKWLKYAPTVRQTTRDRWILWDIIKGKYRSTIIQTWQDAGLILGLGKSAAEDYSQTHKGIMGNKEVLPEELLLAYALKINGCLTHQQEQSILSHFQDVKERGTVYYRPWVKNMRFVDTLGMVIPFFHACGWDDLVNRQLEEYDRYLLNGVFPAHAYDVEKDLPMGVFDWGRGIGWYILALIETSEMDGHYNRIVALADALLAHQKPNGGFGCFVFNKQSRMDSSATALIGLLFFEAFQYTQKLYFLKAAQKAESALMTATRRDGALDYCQGDTYGIGYYSQVFSIMPFAQGMALKLSKRLDMLTNM